VRSSCEHGLYTRGAGKTRLVVGIYVDDLIIIGQDSEDISVFKAKMKAMFKMNDLGRCLTIWELK
jgi:hypothetical protein